MCGFNSAAIVESLIETRSLPSSLVPAHVALPSMSLIHQLQFSFLLHPSVAERTSPRNVFYPARSIPDNILRFSGSLEEHLK